MVENKEKIIVSEDKAGERIDIVIASELSGYTRSRVQKLISEGFVTVNGTIIDKNKYQCCMGDEILIIIPEIKDTEIVSENIPIDIVYEDDDIVIINKPKGMVVHPAPGHQSGTLVNALMHHVGDNLSGINGELRPGIVHRIDKDTTGILVCCKNDKSHLYMSDLLSTHSINRIYYCIVYGSFKENEGTVNAPIGRHPVDRKKMAVNVRNSREAITHYRVLYNFDNKYSLLECKLETGRTHQIRVHLSSIHHPLLGDTVYGKEKQPFKTDGQVLHAALLGFVHPSTNNYVEFKSKLPEYFEKLIYKLCKSVDEQNIVKDILVTEKMI